MGYRQIARRYSVSEVKWLLLLIMMAALPIQESMAQQPSASDDPEFPASVFDEVDECDLLAAHPADLMRVADGVADEAIIPRLAVRACETATKAHPQELRFSYQLGRALMAANRPDQAKRYLERASQGSYAPSYAALADVLLKEAAATGNVKPAVKSAASLYARAVEGGFQPSVQRLEAMTFDATLYTQQIVGQIDAEQFDAAAAASKQPDIRVYIYSLLTNVMGQCGPVLSAESVVRLALYRFGGAVSPEDEESTSVALQPLVGEVDAQRFILRHGCEGPSAGSVFLASVAEFLKRQ